MSADSEKTGDLKLALESKLHYGGKDVRVEIRDSDLILVEPATTKRRFSLPIGLYEVSAVLEDGKRTTQVVEVVDRHLTEIKLVPNLPFQPAAPSKDSDFRSAEDLREAQPVRANMELVDASSRVTIYAEESHWIIRLSEAVEQVAIATIRRADTTLQASLPISAGDHRFSVTCHVKRDAVASLKPLQVNISQSRSIASAMEGMVGAGQIESAARLAGEAIKTLLEKFVDPTGAALAALILHKAGRLKGRQLQLVQMIERFDWLPDGKILLASQLVRDPDMRDFALQLACDASKQRILFTETFSLLLDLLRYWPSDGEISARNEALSRLGKLAPLVDWRSTYLCNVLPEGG